MLNKIWPTLLIISFLFAILTGNLSDVNKGIFDSLNTVINLSLTLLGTMCLWCGLVKIVTKTSLVNRIIKILHPFLRRLFPNISKNDNAYKNISMNIVANILGLGNAATPLGLKAMQDLQKHNNNKDSLSNDMAMLIVLNTASIQIIPTTVIAIRNSLGSNNTTKILIPIWVATFCAALAAISSAKILMKKW